MSTVPRNRRRTGRHPAGCCSSSRVSGRVGSGWWTWLSLHPDGSWCFQMLDLRHAEVRLYHTFLLQLRQYRLGVLAPHPVLKADPSHVQLSLELARSKQVLQLALERHDFAWPELIQRQ